MSAPDPVYGRRAPARSIGAGRRGSRLGIVLGATAAALASAGLAYWIGATKDTTLSAPSVTAAAPKGATYAPVRANAADVIRAHEQLQDIYAEGGSAAVARFGQACAQRLADRPRDLDFCISFKAFSESLKAKKAPAGSPGDLALVRAALPPGQNAEARLAEIQLLAREVSLKDSPATASERRVVASVETAPAKASPPRATSSTSADKSEARPSTQRNADARLRVAYRRAAAAGVNPDMLGREQRQFRRAVQGAPDRAAVSRLYARRIATLEAQARRAEH